MALEDCYAHMEGDLAGVRSRMPSDAFIQKFVVRFLDDTSFSLAMSAWERGDLAEAFRGAHTLKGVCSNLGFTSLYEASYEVAEALRPGSDACDREAIAALMERLRSAYDKTIQAIALIEQ